MELTVDQIAALRAAYTALDAQAVMVRGPDTPETRAARTVREVLREAFPDAFTDDSPLVVA